MQWNVKLPESLNSTEAREIIAAWAGCERSDPERIKYLKELEEAYPSLRDYLLRQEKLFSEKHLLDSLRDGERAIAEGELINQASDAINSMLQMVAFSYLLDLEPNDKKNGARLALQILLLNLQKAINQVEPALAAIYGFLGSFVKIFKRIADERGLSVGEALGSHLFNEVCKEVFPDKEAAFNFEDALLKTEKASYSMTYELLEIAQKLDDLLKQCGIIENSLPFVLNYKPPTAIPNNDAIEALWIARRNYEQRKLDRIYATK